MMKRFPPFHDRYPPELVQFVSATGWTSFRPIQEEAIAKIPIDPSVALPDAIFEAETSSGKTEAAFLPLLARIRAERAGDKRGHGFDLLYISPLRALINDQEGRVGALAKSIGVEVHPWHSDVESSKKNKARHSRRGILLTTPESLEAFFLRSQKENAEIGDIARVSAVVIDELHAFFDTARGRHLQSLLHRLDLLAKRPIPRFGLSATLSGLDESARETLRPNSSLKTLLLRPASKKARKVAIGVKVFLERDKNAQDMAASQEDRLVDKFASELLADFKDDTRGLVFCNSRAGVETLQERAQSVAAGSGLLFEAHHSSVPPTRRKSVEHQMREGTSATRMVVICTNTLELGIDIGRVQRVVQVDPTYTVAALRQRVGRSGRRGDAGAEGIIYVGERALSRDAHPLDRLRIKTFQAMATAQLSLESSFEEPNLADLHLSTLYHQIISILREGTPKRTEDLHEVLVKTGPWHNAIELKDITFFARFLETMTQTSRPLLERSNDGLWRLLQGEHSPKPVYAIFSSPPEYTVFFNGRPIGSLPMTIAYRVGDTFVLSGGRWRVLNASDTKPPRLIVAKASSAGAPRYGGTAQAPSGLVAARMKAIYEGHSLKGLEASEATSDMIKQGRKAYRDYHLDKHRILQYGQDVILFPWSGARLAQTMVLALRREGAKASIENFAVFVEKVSALELKTLLASIKRKDLPETDELAREARQLQSDRFDRYLIPYHQRLAFSRRFLTREGFANLIGELLAEDAVTVG